ncbi:ATP-binding protein [Sphaerisporangium aureirubrum]|uniref:ATP-binding protein n=1 Tax=Sphaerisporangium aureirubrum TaxID=1544736 RepID=A0ABW1N7T4_9ACTN
MALAANPLSKSICLAGTFESVGVARGFVRDVLGEGHPDIDVVTLLASELTANAVRHSRSGRREGGRLVVTVAVGDAGVRVEVVDEGADDTVPVVAGREDALSEGGRGLWLVREMAAEWGWAEDGVGRTVWFHVGADGGGLVEEGD